MPRKLIGADNFLEVLLSTSLSDCEERDIKEPNQEIPLLVSCPIVQTLAVPYERPGNPDLTLETGTMEIDAAVKLLLEAIK